MLSAAPPIGTVTFLFTDVEASTSLLKRLRDRYPEVLLRHDEILRAAIEASAGREVDSAGDGFFAVFPRARDAVAAAVAAQQALAAEPWPEGHGPRVRMGVHTGEAMLVGERYVGLAVHRGARIAGEARGGEILLSQTTVDLLHDDEDELEVEVIEVGERSLKDFDRPVRLYRVLAGGLRAADTANDAGRTAHARAEAFLLGPVECHIRGRSVDLGTPQQRALLALLALRAGEVVPVDAIVDALWLDEPPQSAGKVVQTYVSRLRRELGDDAIARRGRGYRLDVSEVDVRRFERLASERRLGEALELWRGPALADVAHLPALRIEADRLEELRLRAVEERIDDEIGAGRGAEVVAELNALVAANPLRERLRYLLMLALYRSGRQVEALETYRDGRSLLVEELGVEPGAQLRTLEAAILRQEPALDAAPPADEHVPRRGAVLVWRAGGEGVAAVIDLAARLAEDRELIVAELAATAGELAAIAAHADATRGALVERGAAARVVAFTSVDVGEDVARLARDQDTQVALTACPDELSRAGVVPPSLAAVLDRSPCDVGILAAGDGVATGRVIVPFGAAEHDWAAVELAAWLALATDGSLALLGSEAGAGGRDASRMLATASLLLQRHLGVSSSPLLADAGPEGVLAAVAGAALVVVGLPETWRGEGIGAARLALLRDAAAPVLLVRRGDRPGGLAPPGAVTRYSWSRAR